MKQKGFKKNGKGFSLAEAMVATVILGFAAAGVLLPFASGAKLRSEGMHRTLGVKLASDLMEEIVNTPFSQIIGNFNYSELQGQVEDASGTVFTDSNYANFSRIVTCNYEYIGPIQFILATVRVYYSGNEIAAVNRLVSQ